MPVSTTSAVARAAPPVSGGVPKRDVSRATSGVAGRYRPAAGHQRAATGGTSTGQRRPGATLSPSDGNDMATRLPRLVLRRRSLRVQEPSHRPSGTSRLIRLLEIRGSRVVPLPATLGGHPGFG